LLERSARAVLVVFCVVAAVGPARAQYSTADTLQAVVPGLVYKEYTRTMEGLVDWRITDPEAQNSGSSGDSPANWLPNPVLSLDVDDLQGAVRAVAVIDVWGGHVGTSGKQFRLNGNDWHDVPDAEGTPSNPDCYMHQLTVEVEIPLDQLVEGTNALEGTADDQVCYGWRWGQWGWYAFMLRIYYDPATRSPATASITSPTPGSVLRADPMIEIDASSPAGIDRVDVIGRYLDYDNDGDGIFEEWQQSYHKFVNDDVMTLRSHVGTDTAAPYAIEWDTNWIPDQTADAVALIARVRDADGLWTVTDRVEDLSLVRRGIQVALYPPENVPERYWVRDSWTAGSTVTLPNDTSLNTAIGARIAMRTWNGSNSGASSGQDASIQLNGWELPGIGAGYNYDFDAIPLPVGVLDPGLNDFAATSASIGHGIEILWPGPAVVVRYEDYSSTPAFVVDPPVSSYTTEGGDASFRVTALGAEPISYQWQRDGADIDGATDPVLSLSDMTAADDGARVRCIVSNALGSEASPEATLNVLPSGPRITDGQIALYTFGAAAGDTVFDRSGFGAPLDLVIDDPGAVDWISLGLDVQDPVTILATSSADKITNAVTASGAVTLEAWIRPANLTQNGPARIVSLSSGPLERNLTLGQGVYQDGGDRLEVRARSTSSNANGIPALATPRGSLTTALQHVAFTRSADGVARIYVNGAQQAEATGLGSLSNWDTAFELALANEVDGSRAWRGTLGLVAFYDRVLTNEELLQNLAAGPAPKAIATSAPVSRPFALRPNVPNPFNPSTTISFELPARAEVSLDVYDVRGRRMVNLERGSYAAGVHRVRWDGRDASGASVSSGVYFYVLRATTPDGRRFDESRRMVLMK